MYGVLCNLKIRPLLLWHAGRARIFMHRQQQQHHDVAEMVHDIFDISKTILQQKFINQSVTSNSPSTTTMRSHLSLEVSDDFGKMAVARFTSIWCPVMICDASKLSKTKLLTGEQYDESLDIIAVERNRSTVSSQEEKRTALIYWFGGYPDFEFTIVYRNDLVLWEEGGADLCHQTVPDFIEARMKKKRPVPLVYLYLGEALEEMRQVLPLAPEDRSLTFASEKKESKAVLNHRLDSENTSVLPDRKTSILFLLNNIESRLPFCFGDILLYTKLQCRLKRGARQISFDQPVNIISFLEIPSEFRNKWCDCYLAGKVMVYIIGSYTHTGGELLESCFMACPLECLLPITDDLTIPQDMLKNYNSQRKPNKKVDVLVSGIEFELAQREQINPLKDHDDGDDEKDICNDDNFGTYITKLQQIDEKEKNTDIAAQIIQDLNAETARKKQKLWSSRPAFFSPPTRTARKNRDNRVTLAAIDTNISIPLKRLRSTTRMAEAAIASQFHRIRMKNSHCQLVDEELVKKMSGELEEFTENS